jgi:hypothetical protein
MANSYVALSLKKNVEVIEAKEKDKLSVRKIMMRLQHTLNTTHLNRRDEIMIEWLQGNGRMKKKATVTGNEVVREWFTNARSNNIHISGPMVQSEALAVARSLGNY